MRTVAAIFGDPRLPDRTKVGQRFAPEDLESMRRAREALAALPEWRVRCLDDHARLLDALRADPPDLVLNLCDTGLRNEAAHELHLPALCELLGIPCSGAGPEGMVLCFDKALTRAAASELGVAVPAQQLLRPGEPIPRLTVPFPAIVKPNRADGSFGITKDAVVRDQDAARARIAWLEQQIPGGEVLVQELLSGPEYGLTLLGNPGHGLEPLPLLQVDYGGLPPGLPHILGYESKTLPDSPYWQHLRYGRAEIAAADRERMLRDAGALFARLRCRDYARFDFRADAAGNVKLLEVNPNPAWCWDGKMNLMAELAGWSYGDLLRRLLEIAWARAHHACDPWFERVYPVE